MTESGDYPFATWDTYCKALTTHLNGDYAQEYPKYSELMDKYGWRGDAKIIKELLQNGQDAQRGLDMLFQSMIDGCRYSHEYVNREFFVEYMIKPCVEKGAVINIGILLRSNPEYTPNYFEDEMYSYYVRASILKQIQKNFIPDLESILNEKIAWHSIIPKFWENMIDDKYKLDPTFGDFDTARYKALKHEYTEFTLRY